MKNADEFAFRFNKVIEQYMPDEGEGESLASQKVTAVNRLIYKFFNDGDIFDNNYILQGWCNDLSDEANWLDQHTSAHEILCRIAYLQNEEQYANLLYDLATVVLNEDKLKQDAEKPKDGTIYDCKGIFKFTEYQDEDDEDEEYDEFSEDEEWEDEDNE